jgi:hypothetical protein
LNHHHYGEHDENTNYYPYRLSGHCSYLLFIGFNFNKKPSVEEPRADDELARNPFSVNQAPS